MPNRLCFVFVKLAVVSVYLVTAAGGCGGSKGIKTGTGGRLAPMEGPTRPVACPLPGARASPAGVPACPEGRP